MWQFLQFLLLGALPVGALLSLLVFDDLSSWPNRLVAPATQIAALAVPAPSLASVDTATAPVPALLDEPLAVPPAVLLTSLNAAIILTTLNDLLTARRLICDGQIVPAQLILAKVQLRMMLAVPPVDRRNPSVTQMQDALQALRHGKTAMARDIIDWVLTTQF